MESKKGNQAVNSDFEIMIVGGGPAGVSTWLHLHHYDPELASHVVLIEKEKFPRDKLCGGALHKWMTHKVFSTLDIDLTVPFVRVDTLEIRLENDVYTYHEEEFFRIVRRVEFDSFLARIAKNRGCCVHEDETFLDVQYVDDGILVRTSRGLYKVKIVIGADGALSMVRRKMQPPLTPRFAATIEIFSPVQASYDPEFASHAATMDFTAVNEGLQGYVWHFPCLRDGSAFMNHGICDTRIYPEKPRADLKKIFSEELHARHSSRGSDVWSSHPVTYFLEDVALSRPNILLVGDAAGIEPLLGGGIHLSLVYGEVAATVVADALRRDDLSLRRYNEILKGHVLGRYIRKFTTVAKYVYEDKTRILDSLRALIENK
jgi:flavin-dependent dehydrogenase